jgi:hypothetical protein
MNNIYKNKKMKFIFYNLKIKRINFNLNFKKIKTKIIKYTSFKFKIKL